MIGLNLLEGILLHTRLTLTIYAAYLQALIKLTQQHPLALHRELLLYSHELRGIQEYKLILINGMTFLMKTQKSHYLGYCRRMDTIVTAQGKYFIPQKIILSEILKHIQILQRIPIPQYQKLLKAVSGGKDLILESMNLHMIRMMTVT